MIRVVVTDRAFAPDAEVTAFAAGRGDDAGALVTFVGFCRAESANGPVTGLELDHYPGFTETEIQRLAEHVAERHAVGDLLAFHRVGTIPAGDAIVLVAALSAHRAAAFAAVSELMDYLKTDAPLWKREIGPEGPRWIEPTEADRARRKAHGEPR
jgi:molybdopterin synthase catalytic subunit